MSGVEIKDELLTKVMAQAVLTYLTPEKRDELLLKAVTMLFEQKNTSGYGDKFTQIEQAFRAAIHTVAGQEAEALIRNDASIMERIKKVSYEGINEYLDSEEFREKVAGGMKRVMGGY